MCVGGTLDSALRGLLMPHSPSVRQRHLLGKGLSLVGVPETLDRAVLPKVNHDDAGSVSVPKPVNPRPTLTSHDV